MAQGIQKRISKKNVVSYRVQIETVMAFLKIRNFTHSSRSKRLAKAGKAPEGKDTALLTKYKARADACQPNR